MALRFPEWAREEREIERHFRAAEARRPRYRRMAPPVVRRRGTSRAARRKATRTRGSRVTRAGPDEPHPPPSRLAAPGDAGRLGVARRPT
jgi:hypothetical protein